MLRIRSIVFLVAFFLNVAIVCIVSLPLFVLPRKAGIRPMQIWARINLFLLRVICGVKMEIRGRENIPTDGALIASKHQAAWETFALMPILPDPAFILKKELFLLPLFGWYARKFDMIGVDRSAGSKALSEISEKGQAAIDQGRQVIIFPEGTRTRPGAEPAYKNGIAHLYHRLERPVVPVALNSGLFWVRGSILRRPGTIVVEFKPAIPPGLPLKTFRNRLVDEIETSSDRLYREGLAELGMTPPGGADREAASA
ncbi:lysophospholipid acyltransferase family protein [Amorphus orientalis]|uniref:1-acyl-sn-glycerol-3-phosphate acyltransferase n=1 Tax=Amorphus orientalis TaxID=649198 RepID=A0AAE3VSN8_9HYPH|nr:lysophospholipid acyltransferase family protein [Amorphus orientalis]MDQ0317095.1 1-acyl-sn-glycerol-3-phosphate acyltransferase [Amorphus orientalis]